MNRRTFLKAIGLAIAAPGAVLGAAKAAPPDVSGRVIMLKHQGTLTAAMIQEAVRKRLRDSPTVFYYIFVHPNDPNREKLLAHGSDIGAIKYVEYQRLNTLDLTYTPKTTDRIRPK